MAIQVFSIPARGCQESAEEFNQFLRSQRIVAIERQLILDNGNAYWSLCVEYLERGTNKSPANLPTSQRSSKAKVDYREVLNAEDFAAFVNLRDFRKELAAEEAVPVYAVFTNEQLAAIVLAKARHKSDLSKIPGIGDGRLEKYGDRVIERLTSGHDHLSQVVAIPAANPPVDSGVDPI